MKLDKYNSLCIVGVALLCSFTRIPLFTLLNQITIERVEKVKTSSKGNMARAIFFIEHSNFDTLA